MKKGGVYVKRVVSLLLCIILLLGMFCMPASALSKSAGLKALQGLFTDGNGFNFDYVLYSPVKSENDKTKYPLIVFLHGQFSSIYSRQQLTSYNIAYWACDEYQSRIRGTGGAFLYLPRDPNVDIAWSGECSKLKRDLDLFISQYADHIDTDRIYIGGLSMGGRGTMRMVAQYPDFFAAAFPISPVYNPSDIEIRNMANVPTWLISNKYDYLVSNSTLQNVWTSLNRYSEEPHKNRWALFDTARMYEPDGTLIPEPIYWTHDTWTAACNDLFMDNNTPYKHINITNGNGYPVKMTYPNGLLYWISSQGYDENADNPSDDEGDSSIPIAGNIIQKIFAFFKRMINLIMG